MNPFSFLQEKLPSLLPVVWNLRKALHAHPELSWQEQKTTERIEQFLQQHGITEFQRPLDTGGWVDFAFHPDRPFLMLRADIDALPIQDLKEAPYRSRKPGVCHACGHDVHTATMAAVAVLLHQAPAPPPNFNVRIVFQPAEETIPAGAPQMIQAGVLEGVQHALAMHVDPRIPLGTIALTTGWVNMQSIRVEVELSGPGGHSSRPYEGADLIWLASRLVQDSYQMIYRQINWLRTPVVLSFTQIEAGEGYNILPTRLQLTGTLRLTDREVRQQFYRKFEQLVQQRSAEAGAEGKVSFHEGAPPVVNNEQLVEQLRENIRHWPEPPAVWQEFRSPGGDDFGYYAEQVPSALVRFGIRAPGYHHPLHTGHFDVPQEVLHYSIPFFFSQIYLLDK